MEKTSLKSQATKGMIWNAVEKLSVQVGRFVIGIILARLLLPEDFGLIGMLAIFIAISQTFIESGLGSGLVQKQDRTNVDYSTVFVFNFVVSTILYVVLFVAAPYIADFYKTPDLVLLTRVLMISLILNSLIIVQRTIFTIELDFKTIAKINVFAVIISGALGIYFAYSGMGVWALVIQSLTRISVTVIMFWWLSKWRFSLVFSKKSFKNLFGYGSKLLAAGIYAQILNNVYNIAIGKAYLASDLGYYTRAKSFTELTAGTVSSILQQVTFPILASLQGDKDRMISVYRRLIKMSAFFIFPAMTMLSLLADPFIRLALGEKWLFVIVLLQWYAFARIFYPISVLNMNILNATGRSDLFLKLDLAKFPLTVLAMLITIPMGIKAMAIGQVVTAFIAYFMNAYLPGKMYGYGAISQLKDIFTIIIATLAMAAMVYASIYFVESSILKLFIGVFVGAVSYFVISYLLKIEELQELKTMLLKMKG